MGESTTFEHYRYLLNNTFVVGWTINMFTITTGATLSIVAIDSMIALPFIRFDWSG